MHELMISLCMHAALNIWAMTKLLGLLTFPYCKQAAECRTRTKAGIENDQYYRMRRERSVQTDSTVKGLKSMHSLTYSLQQVQMFMCFHTTAGKQTTTHIRTSSSNTTTANAVH